MFTRWSHFLIISFLLLFALFLFYYSICVWWKRNEKRTNFAALVQWQYWWRRQSFSETLWEKHVVSRKKNLSLQLGCNFNYIFKAENWQQPPNVKNCVASGIRLFKHIHLFFNMKKYHNTTFWQRNLMQNISTNQFPNNEFYSYKINFIIHLVSLMCFNNEHWCTFIKQYSLFVVFLSCAKRYYKIH